MSELGGSSVLKEMYDQVRLSWASRSASPLFGAFVIGWLAWNHRLVFLLFSDRDIAWRFAYADEVLYPTFWHVALLGLLGPVASALIYLLALPYPARWIFRFTLHRKKELNDIARQIEGERLLTEAETEALRRQIVEVESQRVQQNVQHEEQFDRLRKANEELARHLQEAKADFIEARAMGGKLRPDQAKVRVEEYLLSRSFYLIFNPGVPRDRGAKQVTFLSNGEIAIGQNNNEHRWSVSNEGELVFLNVSGGVHSRFHLDPLKGNFSGKDVHQREQILSPMPVITRTHP